MIIPTTSSSLAIELTPSATEAVKRSLDRRLFGFGGDDSSSSIIPQSQTAPAMDPAISSATAAAYDAATKAASSVRSQYLASSTDTAAPATTSGADDSVWETGKIAGVSVGAVLAALAAAFIVFLLLRRRRNKKKAREEDEGLSK